MNLTIYDWNTGTILVQGAYGEEKYYNSTRNTEWSQGDNYYWASIVVDDAKVLLMRHLNSNLFPKLIIAPDHSKAKEEAELFLMLMDMAPLRWLELLANAKIFTDTETTMLLFKNESMLGFDDSLNVEQRIRIQEGKVTEGFGLFSYPRGTYKRLEIVGEPIDESLMSFKHKLFLRPQKVDGNLWSPIVCKYEIDQSWRSPIAIEPDDNCLRVKGLIDGASVSLKIEISFTRPPQNLKVEPNNLSQYVSMSFQDTVVWKIQSSHSKFEYTLIFQGAKMAKINAIYEIIGNLKESFLKSIPFAMKIDNQNVDLARVSYATRIEETLTIGH